MIYHKRERLGEREEAALGVEHVGFEVPFGVVFYGSSWSVSVEVCPEGGLDGG